MNVDMNRVREEMAEHWDMTPAEFDTFTPGEFFFRDGWAEIDFRNERGDVCFFIEVNADSEVWNMDRTVSWIN